MELQVDLRLLRDGTKWFAVALVRFPGCATPIPFCAVVDVKQQAVATRGNLPLASAQARTAARDLALASALAAVSQQSKAAKPIAVDMAKCFGQFRRGTNICSQVLAGDLQTMLYVVDLHKRAEHDKNPEAQRELALLRECMEACTDGRCSFTFKMDPKVAHTSGMYRPMNNPWAGRGSNITSGRKVGWAGTHVKRFQPSNGDRDGMWPHDMAAGTGWAGTHVKRFQPSNGDRDGMWPHDMASGRNAPNGARNGMWPSDMSSGVNPFSGQGGHEMTSGTGYAGTRVHH